MASTWKSSFFPCPGIVSTCHHATSNLWITALEYSTQEHYQCARSLLRVLFYFCMCVYIYACSCLYRYMSVCSYTKMWIYMKTRRQPKVSFLKYFLPVLFIFLWGRIFPWLGTPHVWTCCIEYSGDCLFSPPQCCHCNYTPPHLAVLHGLWGWNPGLQVWRTNTCGTEPLPKSHSIESFKCLWT